MRSSRMSSSSPRRCALRAACLFRKTLPSARRCLRRPFPPVLRGPFWRLRRIRPGSRLPDFAVAIGSIDVGLHADQIDDAAEILVGAERELDRHGGAPEAPVDAFQVRSKLARSRSSLLITMARGSSVFLGEAPHLSRSGARRRRSRRSTTMAASAAISVARASLTNILKPGVSRILILVFFHSMAASEVEMVSLR